jgi:hypothetical protein
MNTRASLCVGLLVSSAFAAAASHAVDGTIPLRVYLNKPGRKTKFVAKGAFALPDPNTDNPAAEGGEITFSQGAVSETIPLPAANWSALGNPPGMKGFKYKDLSGATCKKVRVTGTSIKGQCKPTAPGAPPFDAGSDAPISIVLSIGTATQRYCAECPNGGEQTGNPQQHTTVKNCLAPAACPSPPATTPTTTATPTQTPDAGGLCCDFPTGCSSIPSAIACLKLAGGITVGGGAVCDASGNCVPPPGTPAGCCEGVNIFPFCTIVDQSSCEGGGGTFHGSAVCQPSAVCTAICPSDASACTAYSALASACRLCCDAVGTCASACGAAEASSCANAAANTSCADEINTAGCADDCCP